MDIDRYAEERRSAAPAPDELETGIDWERVFEILATFTGTGLLVSSLVFGLGGGNEVPQPSVATQTAAPNRPAEKQVLQKESRLRPDSTKRASSRQSRRFREEPRPMPELPVWESPLHARVLFQSGTDRMTGYVLRSCLSRMNLVVREGDRVSVRCDRKITFCATGDSAGRIVSGTIGTVLKVADDAVSIQFELPRPLSRVWLKRWHVQPIQGQGDIYTGSQAIISAQGGASLIDDVSAPTCHLADGTTVLLLER